MESASALSYCKHSINEILNMIHDNLTVSKSRPHKHNNCHTLNKFFFWPQMKMTKYLTIVKLMASVKKALVKNATMYLDFEDCRCGFATENSVTNY